MDGASGNVYGAFPPHVDNSICILGAVSGLPGPSSVRAPATKEEAINYFLLAEKLMILAAGTGVHKQRRPSFKVEVTCPF